MSLLVGILLVLFGLSYILHQKTQAYEVIEEHGNLRIIRRFVIVKQMQSGITGRVVIKAFIHANIVQIRSTDGNSWIDHSWATSQ